MATKKQKKGLVETAAVLAATALAEKAIRKAMDDPRVRRKAKAAGRTVARKAKAVGRKAKAVTRKLTKRSRKRR